MRRSIDKFHDTLISINAHVLEGHSAFSWTIIVLLIALLIPIYLLKIQTDLTDIMDFKTPEIDFYKATTKAFPKYLNMTALIEKPSGGSLSPTDFQKIQMWVQKIESDKKIVSSVMSPFDVRTPVYDQVAQTLIFPKIFQNNNSDLEKLKNSFWGPFFLDESNKTVLFSLKIKSNLSVLEIDQFRLNHSHLEDLNIQWTGDAIFQIFANEGIRTMNYFNLLGIAFLMFLLWLFYRSSMICLYALLSLILGIGPVLGLMGLSHQVIDQLTSNLFLLLVVATLEDIFFVFYFSSKKQITLRESLKAILIPSLYTSITTAIGFGSLYISDVPTIKNFAIWSFIGALVEWAVVFFVVPTFFRNKLDKTLTLHFPFTSIDKFFSKLNFSGRGRLIVIVPIIVSPFLLGHLSYNASPFDIFKNSHQVIKVKNKILQTRGWEHYVSLIFDENISNGVKKDMLFKIKNIKNVGWIEHPLLMINGQNDPEIEGLIIDNFKMASMSEQYYSKGMERAFIYLRNSDIDSVKEIKKSVQVICKDNCKLSGELLAFGEYSKALVETLSESLILSLGLVFSIILLLCWYLKISQWPKLMLSIMWGPCLVVILFAITKTSVTLVNCILLSTISGLSGDSAIQFIFNKKESNLENSVSEIGPGTFMLTLVLLVLCLPFLLSPFGNVQSAGFLLMISLVIICVGDYLVLKRLL